MIVSASGTSSAPVTGVTWYGTAPTATTTTATYPWPQNDPWPRPVATAGSWPQPAEPQQMPVGWRCTDCQAVMAPWVQRHRCDGGGATVTANTPPAGDAPQPGMLYKAAEAASE